MNKQQLLRWAGSLVAIVAIVWFAKQLTTAGVVFDEFEYSDFLLVSLAVLVYTMSSIISGTAWYCWLRGVGESHLSVFRALSVFCLSQIGKYVPGNVAHHMGRVLLSKQHGAGMTNTLFTMFLETMWILATAALVALSSLLLVGTELYTDLPQVPEGIILVALAIATLAAPLIGHEGFTRLTAYWARLKRVEVTQVHLPPIRVFFLAGALYGLNWLVLGVVLMFIADLVFGGAGAGVFLLAGIFSVAWVTGFVTPGAPAGLGIREVILVAALAPLYGDETAVGTAAVLRIVTLIGDGATFLAGLGFAKLADGN